MDEFTRAYFEVVFERDFLDKKGEAFQDFFSEIMEKGYPGDFQRTRPWGNHGDRKNDGYIRSQRLLYQVYAPNEMRAATAIVKINEDFSEALPFWKDHFDRWSFAHNSKQGLGPDILKQLLDLGKANAPVKVESCGYAELRLEVFKLSPVDIAHLLGPAPSRNALAELRFEKLEPVVLTIARKDPLAELQIRPVPKDKLYHNGLSQNVEILLRAGMAKSDLVAEFFSKWPDPTLGDEVASAFSIRYGELKKANLPPDIIFQHLHSFAGGGKRGTPEHEAAVLAILAHLFEQCDIFEALGNSGSRTS